MRLVESAAGEGLGHSLKQSEVLLLAHPHTAYNDAVSAACSAKMRDALQALVIDALLHSRPALLTLLRQSAARAQHLFAALLLWFLQISQWLPDLHTVRAFLEEVVAWGAVAQEDKNQPGGFDGGRE